MKGRNCHWKVLYLYTLYNSDSLVSDSFLYGATEGLCLVTLKFIDSAPYTAECSGLTALLQIMMTKLQRIFYCHF